jgi:hypothetical protein
MRYFHDQQSSVKTNFTFDSSSSRSEKRYYALSKSTDPSTFLNRVVDEQTLLSEGLMLDAHNEKY